MPRRRLLLALCVIAAIGFAVRLAVAATFQGLGAAPDAGSNPDQVDYELFASRIAAGEGYTLADGTPTARRPPGTSFALVLPYAMFGRDWSAGRVWFCALSAATCVASGLLAAELFGAFAGLLAAAMLALWPGHFYYAMHFLSEVPYGLLIAFACLLAVRSATGSRNTGRGSRALDLAAGALFGLAVLTRPQASFAGPLALLAALMAPRERRPWRVRQVLVVGVAAAAVVLPWVIRNEVQLGKATISTIGGVTFWGASNPVIAADPVNAGGWMPVDTLIDAAHPLSGTEVENDAAAWRYGFEFLRSHPGEVPRLLALKLTRHFSPFRATENRAVYWAFALSWLLLLPFLIAGFVVGWRRQRAGITILLLPMLSTLLTALVFYGSIRFRDADSALYVVPAAAALATLVPARWRARVENAVPSGSGAR